ncbi:hypothetical protein TWF225_002710 [Orbilia oligospora]|uniref:Threonine/serine exporter-like N-terminal domain-containing protein n=1 Tax=Orbilia oligospora TaxID=2813651 RepID=A0A8H2DRW8_ORBOL|nr:hypothetical protein TWF225_002710 [Orbilia oligospora]KAF3233549.1 hypothetical protein TWF128_002956 [Orbilia oligospora]KAF3238649.1 hypothetical protein TWF217_001659 [Orbilia oligospora]TGJ63578.1 hypothetical protein EYR41_011488 [Orbilia oligospora]
MNAIRTSPGVERESIHEPKATPRVHFGADDTLKNSASPERPRNAARSNPCGYDGGQTHADDMSSGTGVSLIQGLTPLLAADKPYIKREEFDEEAAPIDPEIEALEPQAQVIVRELSKRITGLPNNFVDSTSEQNSTTSPNNQHSPDLSQPAMHKPGVLATLLRLSQNSGPRPSNSTLPSALQTPKAVSGAATPSTWYKSSHDNTAAILAGASLQLGGAYAGSGGPDKVPIRHKRPRTSRAHSGGLTNVLGRFSKEENEDEIKLRYHLAHVLHKQKYLLQLCKALMLYGAPTHRLEEYLKMSARVLDVEGQFLYLPGCMIISFDDSSTHTSNMQLVRVTPALNLGKLQDVHLVYKQVIHDVIGVEEGMAQLQKLFDQGPRFAVWLQVLVYGAASASVGPLFSARLIDLPICFLLGTILGVLALVIAPRSTLYSNVFEIVACVVICFLARAFGSIDGGSIFCFAGISQASIALILPGYIVLCGALELQSKNLVAGSVRMFYAIIYSLLLGFGITIGTALYGAVDSKATSSKSCSNVMSDYYKFLFVLVFTLCLNVLNQCKWKQLPMSLGISISGFAVNFFATRRFPTNVQIANALGAFTIGVIGNLYSRLSHQIAFTSIVPAIFIQVPSGLAAQGGLISGLDSADSLTNKTVKTSPEALQSQFNITIANVALGMIQVGIGISVGLFFAAIAVYPFGKRRSGLFTF